MAISVTCGHCSRIFETNDDSQGQLVQCPTCHQNVEAHGPRVRDHDVFISHSHVDKHIALAVCAALENSGVRCWMAPRNIPSGHTWGASIIDAIGDSVAMILIFSSHSNESQQVLREIERAVSKKVEIFAVRTDSTGLSGNFEYFLSASRWFDLDPRSPEKTYQRLANDLANLIAQNASGTTHEARLRTQYPSRRVRRLMVRTLTALFIGLAFAAGGGVFVWQLDPNRLQLGGTQSVATPNPDVSEATLSPVQASPPPETSVTAVEPDLESADSDASSEGDMTASVEPPVEPVSEEESGVDEAKTLEALAKESWEEGAAEAVLRLNPAVSIEFVWISPDRFNMGSPPNETDREDDETLHFVRLTQGFWMAKYEVTQEQWMAVMGAENNPSTFSNPKRPVEGISWLDCFVFIRRVAVLTGIELRLPTEAEWEFACRDNAGSITVAGVSDAGLGRAAWFRANSNGSTQPVGTRDPNLWGLFDMQGNVAEFCADRYGPYPTGSIVDPIGPEDGSTVVVRGGAWNSPRQDLRPANRDSVPPREKNSGLGFRVCL